MTFCKRLSKDGYDAIYAPLMNRARNERNTAHQANLSEAQSDDQKEACAGHYIGPWQRLLKGWMEGKICNLRARRCLLAGNVIKDTKGIIFVPAYSEQTA
ncbi:hypothetical protein L3Q72_09530 [Vibrio sp. JC009]|uniref:hypothetical protein n=1 Tax=Vibrio sp. JC009 TaxID=2912314 RepID=UPI0023B138B1|nr:hypothetical protein [Vibrio sp. JC009]WED20882.1 hypothetical protein L3Q72_09530 [Vibrio sp. JC009]